MRENSLRPFNHSWERIIQLQCKLIIQTELEYSNRSINLEPRGIAHLVYCHLVSHAQTSRNSKSPQRLLPSSTFCCQTQRPRRLLCADVRAASFQRPALPAPQRPCPPCLGPYPDAQLRRLAPSAVITHHVCTAAECRRDPRAP